MVRMSVGLMGNRREFEALKCSSSSAFLIQDFDLGRTIGKGRFARVRAASLKVKPLKTPICIKVMKKSEVIELKQVDHIVNEKDVLGSVNHPFIIHMLQTFQDADRLYMAMELVKGGELFVLLRNEQRFKLDQARFYLIEVTAAMIYLHSMLVVFRDLKPENILIHKSGHVKITDFGFAKFLKGQKTYTFCGTPAYMAPEIIKGKGHSFEVDWWSVGILLFEMLAGQTPFKAGEESEMFKEICNGSVPFPPAMDKTAKDLCTRLLMQDPRRRLGALEGEGQFVKDHAFFKGVAWDEVEAGRNWTEPPFVPKEGAGDTDTASFEEFKESFVDPAAKSLVADSHAEEQFGKWDFINSIRDEGLTTFQELAAARSHRRAELQKEKELMEQRAEEEHRQAMAKKTSATTSTAASANDQKKIDGQEKACCSVQ